MAKKKKNPPVEKWTNREVAEKSRSEGIGYMVTGYLGVDSIADPKLADAWKRAQEAMTEIEKILEPEIEAIEAEDHQ